MYKFIPAKARAKRPLLSVSAIRAIGAGKKVLFLQFMKSKVYSEHTILPTLQNLTLETVGKPFFIIKEGMKSKDELAKWGDEVVVFESGNPPKDYVALIEKRLRTCTSCY